MIDTIHKLTAAFDVMGVNQTQCIYFAPSQYKVILNRILTTKVIDEKTLKLNIDGYTLIIKFENFK